MAFLAFSSEVIIARPPVSAKLAAASIFGNIEPGAN